MILLKEDVPAREVFRIVVVIESGVDGSVQLLKINILVGEDIPPDRFRERIVEPGELEVRDGAVSGLLSREPFAELKHLGKVRI